MWKGRYIPVYASEILEQNLKLLDDGLTPINLKSIMIGRFDHLYYFELSNHVTDFGLTLLREWCHGFPSVRSIHCIFNFVLIAYFIDPPSVPSSYYDILCTNVAAKPLLPVRYVLYICWDRIVQRSERYLN